MFLPLEENDLVHMDRIVALVRDEGETAIILRDGSVMATGFTPRTLARRYAELQHIMSAVPRKDVKGSSLSPATGRTPEVPVPDSSPRTPRSNPVPLSTEGGPKV